MQLKKEFRSIVPFISISFFLSFISVSLLLVDLSIFQPFSLYNGILALHITHSELSLYIHKSETKRNTQLVRSLLNKILKTLTMNSPVSQKPAAATTTTNNQEELNATNAKRNSE